MSNKVNSEVKHVICITYAASFQPMERINKTSFHTLKINCCFKVYKIWHTSLYHCSIWEAKDWKLLGGWALYQTFTNEICHSDTKVILMKPKRTSLWLVLSKLFYYLLFMAQISVCLYRHPSSEGILLNILSAQR